MLAFPFAMPTFRRSAYFASSKKRLENGETRPKSKTSLSKAFASGNSKVQVFFPD
jgi:hypothetical protein